MSCHKARLLCLVSWANTFMLCQISVLRIFASYRCLLGWKMEVENQSAASKVLGGGTNGCFYFVRQAAQGT